MKIERKKGGFHSPLFFLSFFSRSPPPLPITTAAQASNKPFQTVYPDELGRCLIRKQKRSPEIRQTVVETVNVSIS